MPRIRKAPEDFRVEELLIHPPVGHGAYVYLQVEKRICNTDAVATSLARAAGLPRTDIGYAGRKDRFAITRQWFSVPASAAGLLEGWRHPGARIIARKRHTEKLRIGRLKANRFRLLVRDVDEPMAERARQRLEILVARGMPNRFGRQRFGRNGRNVLRGAEILHRVRRATSRNTAWLMISALQAAVFNRVLENRTAPLDELLAGDVAIVHETGEVFVVEQPPLDTRRLSCFELSPTGPIFGTEMLWPRGQTAELERQAMAELGVDGPQVLSSPQGIRLRGGRRSLRAKPRLAHMAWRDGALFLNLDLPPGSYATVLLEELFSERLDDRPIR